MSREYKIIKQLPKPKDIGLGILSIDNTGSAMIFDKEGNVLADMIRTRIDFAAKMGIIILLVWIWVISLELQKLQRQCLKMWSADIKLFKQLFRMDESITRKLGALYGSDYDEWVKEQSDKEIE